jgi:hypothetical protein
VLMAQSNHTRTVGVPDIDIDYLCMTKRHITCHTTEEEGASYPLPLFFMHRRKANKRDQPPSPPASNPAAPIYVFIRRVAHPVRVPLASLYTLVQTHDGQSGRG